MSTLIVTVDIDWAPEIAIEETLSFLLEQGITPTIFSTHPSPIIDRYFDKIEVGLHPYFGSDSSHGSSITEVVKHVLDLPHNFPAYRSHRFLTCNASKQAMMEAGMRFSSNVCTDLEIVPPFKDRFGLWELPIFLEDGGYLFRQHPLEIGEDLLSRLHQEGANVITIHPMHFAVNTPYFSYMAAIKQSVSREEWNALSSDQLRNFRWKGRGIRDFLVDLIKEAPQSASMGAFLAYKRA